MGDLTEQEKLEKRRARRQQRILASAESRLSKITGSQAALRETPSPTPSPSTSSSSIQESSIKNTLAEHYPAPNDVRRRTYEERLTPSPSNSFKRKQQQHRPVVQKMIEEEQASSLNENGFLGGRVPQLLLANMLRKTNPEPKRSSSHPANKYWNLLHFVSMVWLGFLAVYEEMAAHGISQVPNLIQHPNLKQDDATVHFPVFWYFVTLEIAMRFGRTIYQPDYKIPDESVFSSIASQLPILLQQPACFLQKYGFMATGIFKDLCIVIFIIGFMSLSIAIIQ